MIGQDAFHIAADLRPQLLRLGATISRGLLQVDSLVRRVIRLIGLPSSGLEDPDMGLDQLMLPIDPQQLQVGPHPELLSPVRIRDRVVALVQDQMAVRMHGTLFPFGGLIGLLRQGQQLGGFLGQEDLIGFAMSGSMLSQAYLLEAPLERSPVGLVDVPKLASR